MKKNRKSRPIKYIKKIKKRESVTTEGTSPVL